MLSGYSQKTEQRQMIDQAHPDQGQFVSGVVVQCPMGIHLDHAAQLFISQLPLRYILITKAEVERALIPIEG